MRRFLIILLIIILLIGLGIMVTSGIKIGGFEISSIEEIINNNKELDTKIAELDNIRKSDYTTAQTSLNTSFKNLQSSKQKYQDTINYSTEDQIKAANQIEKYEIGFIWTKVGLYATKNNITMKADVSSGTVADLYNISFTAIGEYLSISEFINAIEKDSKLGFKIEDFNLIPYAEEKLQATFVVKNIAIDKDSLTSGGVVANNNNNSNNSAETTTTLEDQNAITQ